MFYKLALKNVSKSMKDYAIYFLTVTFGVCVFYTFNSLDSQQSMMMMSMVQKDMILATMQIITYVSVFISFVLAFLILYANKFMMKRRKKELGTYMLLGMPKSRMSMILMAETGLIGVLALAVGLLLGVALSQGIAVVTAKMFVVQLKEFQFIFSYDAFLKTILYFAIIFVVVMAFNVLTVSRCKLIDLLTAERKNETLKVKKLWVSVVLFLASAVCLGFAYHMIMENGMLYINNQFGGAILLGSIGTLLFFMSLSGFLLRLVKTSKRLYYKNLNIFVLRQINSKINTTYISMTVICILLLLAIGILTIGSSFGRYMSGSALIASPYDLTVDVMQSSAADTLEVMDHFDTKDFLKNGMGVDTDALFESCYQSRIYSSGLTIGDIVDLVPEVEADISDYLKEQSVGAISLSDFNASRSMLGKEPLQLKEDQYLPMTTAMTESSAGHPVYVAFVGKGVPLEIGGRQLTAVPTPAERGDGPNNRNFSVLLVVPDSIAKQLPLESLAFSAMYRGDKMAAEEQIMPLLMEPSINGDRSMLPEGVLINAETRIIFYQMTSGLQAMILFVGMYLGIIFLITSAAILALQQLSEAADNVSRYRLLRKLGVENNMLNHAIFTQVAIYFFIPLLLAIVHSVVGIKAFSTSMDIFSGNAVENMVLTAVCLLVVYGGYFLATYFGCKALAKARKEER